MFVNITRFSFTNIFTKSCVHTHRVSVCVCWERLHRITLPHTHSHIGVVMCGLSVE